MERLELTRQYDRVMEVDKWVNEIPYLRFKKSWEVQVTPPEGGTTIRFIVKKGKAIVSVYLDCYNHQGSYQTPYWEVWNGHEEFRCSINEPEKLMKNIALNLEGTNLVLSFFMRMFVLAKQRLIRIPQARGWVKGLLRIVAPYTC